MQSGLLPAALLALAMVVGCGGGDDDDDDDSCQLSGGCDFIVNSPDECPDPVNTNFCDGICAGAECCYCDGDEPSIIYIDCFDCFDASVPDARVVDGGPADAGAPDAG